MTSTTNTKVGYSHGEGGMDRRWRETRERYQGRGGLVWSFGLKKPVVAFGEPSSGARVPVEQYLDVDREVTQASGPSMQRAGARELHVRKHICFDV